MKKYLLDTQVFLWWHTDDKRLSTSIRSIIQNPENLVIVSVVSAWEICIKLNSHQQFKLDVNPRDLFSDAFEILNIKLNHTLALQNLPNIHRDPFDRLLICQAQTEKLQLITNDHKILKYKQVDLISASD